MKSVITLLVLVLATAACSTTVDGSGSVAARPKPLASTGATSSAPDPVDVRKAIVRTPSQTPIGDPVTADLCAPIPKATLTRWGEPAIHTYQSAGRCYYNVITDDSSVFQLDTDLVTSEEFDSTGTTTKPGTGKVSVVYEFPYTRDDCGRAFLFSGYVFETHTEVLTGTASRKTLCAAADALIKAQSKVFTRGVVPRRRLPVVTMTHYDLCELMSAGQVKRAPGLAALDETYDVDLGGGCYAEVGPLDLQMEVVIIDNQHSSVPEKHVRVGKHELLLYSGKTGCEVESARNAVPGEPQREYLDVSVGGSTGQQACQSAEYAAAYALDTAGLT